MGTESSDPYQNGKQLSDALAEAKKRIHDTAFVGDTFNEQPYTVRLAPGNYFIGPLEVPDNVILEGAGIGETVLQGSGEGPLLTLRFDTVLRDLRVSSEDVGVRIAGMTARLERVSIQGEKVGIETQSLNPVFLDLFDSTVQGGTTGAALSEYYSLRIRTSSLRGGLHALQVMGKEGLRLQDAVIQSSRVYGGVLMECGRLSVENVTLQGSEGPVFTLGESAEVNVHGSRISGITLLSKGAEDATLRSAGRR